MLRPSLRIEFPLLVLFYRCARELADQFDRFLDASTPGKTGIQTDAIEVVISR